jgi:ectoine hydroxylase-related dioxygenase (phytanoyl-CoA dioxygenase family)
MARIIEVSTTLGSRLTGEQRARFERDGFLHFRGFLEPHAVQAVLQAKDELSDRWVREGVKAVNGTPIKYGRDSSGKPIVQRFAFASLHHPVLAELMADPRLNALLELIGGDARLGLQEKDGLVINHYENTDASNFTQMGWHTDALRDIFLGRRIRPMINVGIHLDDQDPRNGGLRLLPGTHRQGMRAMLFRKRYFADTDPDPDEVAFDIKAGDLTVHDGRLWHRVERSRLTGEASRRRVMYVPIVSGPVQVKTANSRTPFYHRFQHLVR